MPPRYAYWTILIDGKATAFRAKESEELLPTLNQLRRKNTDVVLRYFSRGKLWDSPEQAQWAASNARGLGEKRGADWRPGGTHKDPRARFDNKRKDRNASSAGPRDTTSGGYREDRRRPAHGDSRPSGPPSKFSRERKGDWKPKPDRPRENNRPPKPFHDREHRGGDRDHRSDRGPANSYSQDRGGHRPPAKPRHEGDRPWSGKAREQNRPEQNWREPDRRKPDWREREGREQKPREQNRRDFDRRDQDRRDQDRRPPDNQGHSEGRRPWTPKPRTEGTRPWTGKPGGRPDWSPKGGNDRRPVAPKPDFQNRGDNRPREDRPRGDRPRDDRSRNDRFGKPHSGGWSGKPGKKPWTPKPDRRDSARGSLPPSTERPRRDDWRTRPDRPEPSEKPDKRQDSAPKPVREDRVDRPPAAEKIVTRPKPPERG